MNSSDIKDAAPRDVGDRLLAIFGRQLELMESYISIERKTSLGLGLLPLAWEASLNNIDRREVQAVLRDVAWRAAEELVECADALSKWEGDHHGDSIRHAVEEAADALHFVVEMCLVAGIDHEAVCGALGVSTDRTAASGDLLDGLWWRAWGCPREAVSPSDCVGEVFRSLGRAAGCLKNKPWKQTEVETDREKFVACMAEVLLAWMSMAQCRPLSMSPERVFQAYFSKAAVNALRQESRY